VKGSVPASRGMVWASAAAPASAEGSRIEVVDVIVSMASARNAGHPGVGYQVADAEAGPEVGAVGTSD
jgi:hypothetical protein